MLPLKVGDRHVLADALHILMPGGYTGMPLALYRGTADHEARRRIYGFSWTSDISVARSFAQHWTDTDVENPGVVLQTLATNDAILLRRAPQDYYDEGEVVVDPFRLGKVRQRVS